MGTKHNIWTLILDDPTEIRVDGCLTATDNNI